MARSGTADQLIQAAATLRRAADRLTFSEPVAHVYNPLAYAWEAHRQYLERFGGSRKRVVFLGMNPGPFGMMQTGIPFGEIAAVRDWLGIQCRIRIPKNSHPGRPIEGFDCPRSEVSGRRLWGLFAQRFGEAGRFFEHHFVANYCPLSFLEASGRNRTPDKLKRGELTALTQICHRHLRALVTILRPDWVIGIGAYAEKQARESLAERAVRIGRVLHPSPASPAANHDWAGTVTRQMRELGIWPHS